MGSTSFKVPIREGYIPTPTFSHALMKLSFNETLGLGDVAGLGL